MPTISDTDVDMDVDVDVDVDIVDDVKPNDTAIETAETETLTKQEQTNRLETNDDKQNDTDERVEHDNNTINNDKIHHIIAENDKSTSRTDLNETLTVANNNNNNNHNNHNEHKHTNEFNDTKLPTIPARRSNTKEKIESQSPMKSSSISLSSEDSGKESRIFHKRVSVASGEDERKKNSIEQAVTSRVRDNKLGSRNKINADWLTQSIYDIDNRELLLQRLSINNPFYRFRKHSTSLREISGSTANLVGHMRKISSDTALCRGAWVSPTTFANINVAVNVHADDEIISMTDQSADNNVITNPFSIFHDNEDEERRECGKSTPLRLVMRPLQQQRPPQMDGCHAFNHFERQDFGQGSTSAALKQRSRIIFKKFSLRKWHKSHLTNANVACNRDVEALPQLKKLKISYPDRTQRETLRKLTPKSPTPSYFERLQAKTRLGLQKMRDKCRYFRQTTTAPSARQRTRLPAAKDLSFRYISDTEHINSYEAHCSLTRKQSLLYKSYKSEFELSKNLHYLDAYLQQNFDQHLGETHSVKQKSHSVGRIPARQRTLNAHYVAVERKKELSHNRQSINYERGEIVHSDSLSSSEYASVFSPSYMRTIAAGAGETVTGDLAQFDFENLSPSLTVTAGENLLTQLHDPTNYPYLNETPAAKKLLLKGNGKQQRDMENVAKVVLVHKRNLIDNNFQLGFNQSYKRQGDKYHDKLWQKEECNNIKHESYLEHFERHKQPESRSSSNSSNSNNSGCGNPKVEVGNRERVTSDTFGYNQYKKIQLGHEQFYDDGFGENGLTTENINADKCGTDKKLRYTRERSHLLHNVVVSVGSGGMLRASDKGSFVISNVGNSAGNKVATTANTFQTTQRVLGATRPLTFVPHTSLNHVATLRTADSNSSSSSRRYDDDDDDDDDDGDGDGDGDDDDDLPGSRYDSDDESDDDNTRQRDQYTQIDTGNGSGSGSNTTTPTTTTTGTTITTPALAHGSRNTDKSVHNTYSNSTKLMVKKSSGSRYNFTGSLHSSSLSTTSSSSASTTSQTNQQMLATKFYLPNTQYKYEFIKNQLKQQKYQQQQQTVGNYQARRRSSHSIASTSNTNSSSDHFEKDNFFHNTHVVCIADKLPVPTTPPTPTPTPALSAATPMKTMLTAYDSDVVSPAADYKNAKIRAFSRVLSPALSQHAQQSGAMHQQQLQLAHQRHHHYRVTASAIAKEDPTTTAGTPYISALNYYGTGAAVDSLYAHTYASSAKNTCTNIPTTPKKQASSTTSMPPTHTTATGTQPAHPVPGYILEYEC